MALQALLLTRDPDVQKTIKRVLDSASIDVDFSNNVEQARLALTGQSGIPRR